MRRLIPLATLLALSSTSWAERLSVDDAVKLALQQNPRFRGVRERALAAHDQAKSLRGRMGVSIHLSEEDQFYNCPAAFTFGNFAGGAVCLSDAQAAPPIMLPPALGPLATAFSNPIVARAQNTSTFVASADQPIVGLLHLGYDYAAANDNAKAADQGVQVSAAAVRQQVATGFLQFYEAKALEQIAAASVEELNEQVKVARARLNAGVITNADLLRVVVAAANARQQQIVASTSAEVARANLLNIIGLPPDDRTIELEEPRALLAIAASPLPDESSAQRQAVAQRPELKQAKLALHSAEQTRKARWLSLLPEVDAEGAYLRIDGQLFAPPNEWYVGVRASWAIWEWGATFYQGRAATHLAQAAALDQASQALNVTAEVTTNLSQSRAAAVAVEVAQTAIASAEEAYRVTNALVQAGTATTTDLLDAQAALTTARLNLARAQYERAIQHVSLERVLGDK